jgi:hypothetical protein
MFDLLSFITTLMAPGKSLDGSRNRPDARELAAPLFHDRDERYKQAPAERRAVEHETRMHRFIMTSLDPFLRRTRIPRFDYRETIGVRFSVLIASPIPGSSAAR